MTTATKLTTAAKSAPKKKGSPKPKVAPDLAARLAQVEKQLALSQEQIAFLLKGRPGRKYLPITVSKEHVCGVEPERNSAACTDASLWRRNKGCLGDACVAKSTKYYQDYRKARAKSE